MIYCLYLENNRDIRIAIRLTFYIQLIKQKKGATY